MMLIILDKNPFKAAQLVPDRLKFKQLIELGQLICGAGISDVFKPVRQGKKLQEWVKNNPYWVHCYFKTLLEWVYLKTKIKVETSYKLQCIKYDLWQYIDVCKHEIKTAIFRYKMGYRSNYKTNSELPIDIAIEEYKKYMEWKGANRCKKNKQ